MNTTQTERGRITTRVPAQVQQKLEIAASMVGATVNQFVVQTALREAERIIGQERFIRLDAEDSLAFVKALDNPPPPNRKLLDALQDHAARFDDTTGTLDWTPQPKVI
jgi:uncharacterized protein (DUF1778 family)